MNNDLKEIIKPENCLLAVAIPLTKKDVIADFQRQGKRKEFIKNHFTKEKFEDEWKTYRKRIISTVNILEKLGVKIERNLTLEKLANIFKNKNIDNIKVIIFMTHGNYADQTLEMFDGMVNEDEAVKKIPESYKGILDLCICEAVLSFAEKLRKRENRKHNILASRVEIGGSIELQNYLILFELLNKKNYSFSEAHDVIKKSLEYKSNFQVIKDNFGKIIKSFIILIVELFKGRKTV